MHQLKKKEYSFAILAILCFALLSVLASGAALSYQAPSISTHGTISTPTYRGMQTSYGQLTVADVQNIQSYGGTEIEYNGGSYATMLPAAITSPSQVSSSLFATYDEYASWAETYHIMTTFTFVSLADTAYGQVPSWMLSLAGGSGPQLEYDYFTGNSAVSTVATSITCLWQAFASRYAGNPYVIFDFFNEPFYSNVVVTPSNYRTLETDYSNIISSLITAVRSIDPSRTILVDAPFMIYEDMNYGTIPIGLSSSISNYVWEFHCYMSPSILLGSPSTTYSWGWYIAKAAQYYVTDLGKPLFIGEYGIVDNSGYELEDFTNWQGTLSSMVTYLQTLPIWGYQWNAYPWLYGQPVNLSLISQGYTDTYTASDSTYILNAVLNP